MALIPDDDLSATVSDAVVTVMMDAKLRRRDTLRLSAIEVAMPSGYSARFYIDRAATASVRQWLDVCGRELPRWPTSRLRLGDVDKKLSAVTAAPPIDIDDPNAADDDDDLDAIEKAARATLHGTPAVPPPSRPRHATKGRDLMELFRLLVLLSDSELQFVLSATQGCIDARNR